jgi:hypothetical protein
MPQYEPIPGPIDGLRLPVRVWKALQRENITTIDQLRAAAGRLERFDDIGRKMAAIIRAELARAAPLTPIMCQKSGLAIRQMKTS